MNVTGAVLPVMRRQRSGHVISISSGAGLMAFEYSSVYAASKSGLEGWMTAFDQEVAPFGISTTIVNPGFFRTSLASPESLIWPELSIDDYAERSAEQRSWWAAQDGQQPGDPGKLERAILTIANEKPPPRHFIAGADVITLAERKIADLQAQIESHRALSESLTFDPPHDAGTTPRVKESFPIWAEKRTDAAIRKCHLNTRVRVPDRAILAGDFSRRPVPVPTRWWAMRVEPLRLEWIEALIDGDAAFTERFGIAVIEGWAGFPEALPHALDAARRHNADPWGSHLFFDDDGALVGFGGYKGPPSGERSRSATPSPPPAKAEAWPPRRQER